MVISSLQGIGKKPYQKPNLRVYGDLQTLTKSVNLGKTTDATMPNKTH